LIVEPPVLKILILKFSSIDYIDTEEHRPISGLAVIINSGPMDFDLEIFNRRFY